MVPPPLLSVTGRMDVIELEIAKVPPLRVNGVDAVPSWLSAPTTMLPPVMVVPP